MTVFWKCPTCDLIFCMREELRLDDYVICRCCGREWIVDRGGDATAVSTARASGADLVSVPVPFGDTSGNAARLVGQR